MTADITRTWPVSGKYSKEQAELWRLVLAAQEAGMKAAVAGNHTADVEKAAEDVVKAGLLKLGLITDAASKQHRTWYTHGICHWIGLDVHDVGDYRRPLEPGMAFVIEPGLYIREQALDALEDTPENRAFKEKVQAGGREVPGHRRARRGLVPAHRDGPGAALGARSAHARGDRGLHGRTRLDDRRNRMPVAAFEPKFMKIGVLTAALQELTPREKRDKDPDLAIEEWLAFARELGADYIQLSAALHPTKADVPAEAMLDPVANTLDLRKPFDKDRAKRVKAAQKAHGVGISDIGYFDNMLHDDPRIRRKKHDFMRRAMDAAVLLGVDAVCGFVGRNQEHSMDENLVDFERSFVPLLKYAKERKLTYRVEQCPMPGWTTKDNWHNNIAYTPGTWIALHRICEKHGVGDQFRIHYDPSHAILMGQDTRSLFQYLKDEGYNFLIGGFHVKGQVTDAKGVSAWGYGGQTVERGDWIKGKPSPRPADQLNAWKKQVVLCEHELPGTARHDPLAYLQNRTVDWLDHQLAARELLKLDVANTHLVVEHEYPKARIQDKARLEPILQGSIAFTRKIDEAAACMHALQNVVLKAQGIPVQGHGRQAYRS